MKMIRFCCLAAFLLAFQWCKIVNCQDNLNQNAPFGQGSANDDPKKRQPVPNPAEIRKAKETIKQLYGPSFASRDTKVIKEAAKTLVKDAIETKNDWPIRFQMLATARDVFADLMDVSEFARTCKQLATDFEIGFGDEMVSGFSDMSKKLRDPTTALAVGNASKVWSVRFNSEKEFDAAKKMVVVLQTIARKMRNKELLDEAKTLRITISQTEKLCADFETAKNRLSRFQDDPDANLIIARYFAIVDIDVDKAISHFANSSSKELSAIAKTDATGNKMEAAELWLKAGKDGEKMEEVFFLKRSRQLFKKLVENESGITKRKIEKSLARIDGILVGANEKNQDLNKIGRQKGTVIIVKIKTTSPKAIIIWDASSEGNYGVIYIEKSIDPGLKHASSISIDGELQTNTNRDELHAKIADGQEHELRITMGPGFEDWKEFSAESNNVFHGGSYALKDGYVKFVGFQSPK